MRLVGISGSLRKASYSSAILETLIEKAKPQAVIELLDIGSLPHYNGDLELDVLPKSVTDARSLVSLCDGVVVVSPEFNHGIPGVLKNTLDWLSRPAFESCLLHKPVFFVTQSMGELGGVRAQYQLRETFASMLCHLLPIKEAALSHIGKKIVEGKVIDNDTEAFLARTIERVISEINQLKHSK
ncbi:NAD(P)H-dependent oxidoreductase [Gammaproteobacteria bacterium ESL0073]|nr:NAD(P)H-dependent oxidoreductase [Gammaproteobacteria bacterium ESL0073]